MEKKEKQFQDDPDRIEEDSVEEQVEAEAVSDERSEDPEVVDAEEVIEAELVEEDPAESASSSQTVEVERLTNQILRLQADFQNYQKRMAREKENTIQYANESLMIKILDVVDNFDRALVKESDRDPFYEGMVMIQKQLVKALESSGLEEVPSDGMTFDPNLHNAVLSEENPDFETGQIIETLQKGYKLNGKLIRPAMVKVAQ